MAGGRIETTTIGNAGGIRFIFQVPDGERIAVSLKLRETVEDWRPFWREYFAPKFLADVQRNFELEGQYVGGWPALSPGYAAWKAKKFPGTKILERTGRLKKSLVWEGHTPGPDSVYREGLTEVEIGTAVPYGEAHQKGVPGRLPQRRFLWMAGSETYGRLIHQYLVDRRKALKGAGD